MQLQPIITSIEAAVSVQLAIAGGDQALEEAASRFLAALEPSLRQAGLELAQQAATEISAQLGDRTIEVVIVDGDPVLRVGSATDSGETVGDEDFDARLTLRLPPTLKGLVEQAAGEHGDSVNTWVVRTLNTGIRRSSKVGRRVTGSFDL